MLSLGRPTNGARKVSASVTVMLECLISPSQLGPDICSQNSLVYPFFSPRSFGRIVGENFWPNLFPLVATPWHSELASPTSPKHWHPMIGIVPHCMKPFLGLKPFLHSCRLPPCRQAVQVPADEKVDLGVEGWEKPPKHGKQLHRVTNLLVW